MSTETMIAVAAALVLGAGTVAVAMINYEANAPPCGVRPAKRSRRGLCSKPGGRLRHR